MDMAAAAARRVLQWRLRTRLLVFPRRPLIMGIVNVTPDSFSDGGHYLDAKAAIDHGWRLIAEGADLLDVGGESTRPYATPVPAADELQRVLPVLAELCRQQEVPVSIDTSKGAVARAAIEAGAEIINDVTGLTGDPDMIDVARQSGAAVCAMHMRGTPMTMQDDPVYSDVVQEVYAYLRDRQQALIGAGIESERICLDPGIGFGKTHQHNLQLLRSAGGYHRLKSPLLFGHSRKGFIGHVLKDRDADRTAGTIGVALALARAGIQIVRVHDVRAVRDAMRLYEAAGGLQDDVATAL